MRFFEIANRYNDNSDLIVSIDRNKEEQIVIKQQVTSSINDCSFLYKLCSFNRQIMLLYHVMLNLHKFQTTKQIILQLSQIYPSNSNLPTIPMSNSPTKPKQNRCMQHSQQIVALCIDQACTQPTKALCPLQLYNDHLDHKFQNISKIHSDWALYGKDAREVGSNISRENVVKYMDGIIEELVFKIKEHLFLVRKQFEVKMGVYYSSKPVEKIKTALSGIEKCLSQRFLDLKHEQIENAKFFIQVYGMKKLVNDTLTQKQNFQKQILIAFARLKQQMFMDYPKFNALFKAKEYEYCQVIKNQKTQLQVYKSRLSQISGGYDRITEQHKQLTYQLNRANNQLKAKQLYLSEATQKLKLITKKYNQQAEQAIVKAREIKTRNIFGVYASQHLYRVSDRVVKTGDKEMDWPCFVDVGKAEGRVFVKVNRFDVGAWVLLGVMYRNTVQKNEYEFDNYKTTGHGTYLMDSNRWCYSDSQQDYNCKPLGFEYGKDDVIKIQVFNSVVRFSKMAFGWEEEKFQLPYEKRSDDQLVFCVGIKGEHTEVQLV